MTIRTLVLSGGGGRGAFHAGVYKYLSEADKAGVDDAHRGAWTPDIIVGTSIGAVNGAAIAQGMSAGDLERFWLSLQEHDIQGIPHSMGWLARWVVNRVMRAAIGTALPRVDPSVAMSPPAAESWPPLPILPRALSQRLIGRWSNVLDTGPLHQTLIHRMGFDEAKIAHSDKALLISATNVRTGEGMIFSNRPIRDRHTGKPRADVQARITSRRIIASCSIPMMYPWTKDEDGEIYWDGAIVANTPLGPAFDAVPDDRPIDEEMEAVIVLLNPWWESDEEHPVHEYVPQDFGEAITWTLDWALLASFRRDLKLARMFNSIARANIERGDPQRYRIVRDVIVAPDQFLPVERIIDYDEAASTKLIEAGYNAAQRVFTQRFGAPTKD